MSPMKTHGHPCRKLPLATLAVVALVLIGGQGVVAGLHLACHADIDAAGPVHGCAVCAHYWLGPAALATDTVLPLPLSATVLLPEPASWSSATLPSHVCVRAPPTVVS